MADASKVTELPLHNTFEGRPEVKPITGIEFVSTVTVTTLEVAIASEPGHTTVFKEAYTSRR